MIEGERAMQHAATLRGLLKAGKLVIAPGCYDGITARAVERAGFPALYMTGAGTAATTGFPDYGLVTMSEMVANAGRITAIAKVPLIADADTGYGNELNVVRTVREFARLGVAAIHIEDQGFPKRCGHLDDKEIVPLDDYIAKIRAAADARPDPDFVLIARTDARAGLGLEEAIQRANAALAAGADVAFVEAPQTMDEVAAVPRLVKGPCLLNVVAGGKTPHLDLHEAERMGYALAIVPGLLMKAVVGACDMALSELKKNHAHPPIAGGMTVQEFFRRVGADEWEPLRERYRRPPNKAAAE
jgi:2-methylisocitrate lyase-like PEP mutase family enzyme